LVLLAVVWAADLPELQKNVMIKTASLTIVFYILLTHVSAAQKFDFGSWNILNLKYNIDNKWSVFSEA